MAESNENITVELKAMAQRSSESGDKATNTALDKSKCESAIPEEEREDTFVDIPPPIILGSQECDNKGNIIWHFGDVGRGYNQNPAIQYLPTLVCIFCFRNF